MKIVVLAVAACILAAASGCSSVLEGRHQAIMINTNPMGAECGLYRQSLRIATVQSTPSSALIEKSKHGIWVVCAKPGYQQATYFNRSGVAVATVGNFILGGGIGWAIDSASGADNKYDSPVNISLVPNAPGQAETAVLPATYAAEPPPRFPAPVSAPEPAAGSAQPSAAPAPVTAPALVASAAPAVPSSAFDGTWLMEMQLSTVPGNRSGGECPTRHSLSVTFANGSAEGPWGRLRFASDAEIGGWIKVEPVASHYVELLTDVSGRIESNVAQGTVSGRCTGSFVMKKQ
ncbi:MAG TPA: hypothetical protein VEB21_17305 [Terriglobales bacterium]|nr:hypothetical protein [Reyranella sp.]HYD50120.1 hypothetical protein [Terriglobales bacterium]